MLLHLFYLIFIYFIYVLCCPAHPSVLVKLPSHVLIPIHILVDWVYHIKVLAYFLSICIIWSAAHSTAVCQKCTWRKVYMFPLVFSVGSKPQSWEHEERRRGIKNTADWTGKAEFRVVELGTGGNDDWTGKAELSRIPGRRMSVKAVFCLPPRLQEPLRALDSQKRDPNASAVPHHRAEIQTTKCTLNFEGCSQQTTHQDTSSSAVLAAWKS